MTTTTAPVNAGESTTRASEFCIGSLPDGPEVKPEEPAAFPLWASGIVRSVILREPLNALDPRMRAYWLTQGAIVTLVVAGLVIAATVILAIMDNETAAWIVGGLGALPVAVLAVLAVVVARLDYRHFRYEVTELGLYVAKGWLFRRWQVVPHARVQTVDTKVGPLMRAFGLVSVAVTTASAAGGTEIPGLRPEVADALVEELARRAGLEEGT